MSGDRRQQGQSGGEQQSARAQQGGQQQRSQTTRQQQAAPQYQQGYGQGYAGGSNLGKYAIFGVGVFLGLALTTLLSLFLYYKLSPEALVVSLPFGEVGYGARNYMLVATAATFSLVATLSALVGIGVGVFSGRNAEAQTSAPLAGVIPAAAGSAAALFVLIVLLFLVVPSGGGNQIGKLFAPTLGVVMGTAAAGALGGFLGDRTTDW